MKPTNHTLDILRENECWAVAALSVDSSIIRFAGTRSQSMQLSARVIVTTDDRVDNPLSTEQYVADHAILDSGKSYVVILICNMCHDRVNTWKVIQAAILTSADPSEAVLVTYTAVNEALSSSDINAPDKNGRSGLRSTQQEFSEDCVIQIGDISYVENRIRITGLVVKGSVSRGDRLTAIGLGNIPFIVEEVVTGKASRPATVGETCLLFITGIDRSLADGGTSRFFGLASAGCISNSSSLQASLAWASLHEKPLPDHDPGFAPAVRAPLEDTRVRLRFADVIIYAVIKAPAELLPQGAEEERTLVLDKKVFYAPGLQFFMDIDSEFAAFGKIL